MKLPQHLKDDLESADIEELEAAAEIYDRLKLRTDPFERKVKMEQPFYVVYSQTRGFTTDKIAIFYELELAQKEAEMLLRNSPDNLTVFIMKAIAKCELVDQAIYDWQYLETFGV